MSRSPTDSTPLSSQFEWRGAVASSNGSKSGNSFLTAFAESCRGYDQREQEWISGLRKRGVKAAHPDDGWVDRRANKVTFTYPQFDDCCIIGDLIALGDADEYRLVKIIGKEESLFGLHYWRFAPCADQGSGACARQTAVDQLRRKKTMKLLQGGTRERVKEKERRWLHGLVSRPVTASD